jgi:Uma2 family endonuclease
MATVAERLTADAYLARDDPRRTELIDGVVVVNEPSVLHQRLCARIFRALDDWTATPDGHGDASLPINVPLDTRNVLAPDVLWFAEPLDLRAINAPRAPDLAVEVRSPGTWRYDVGRKRELYEQHGVAELWLADTASRTLIVYRRSQAKAGFDVALELGADATLTSPLLHGFAAAVGELVPGAGEAASS